MHLWLVMSQHTCTARVYTRSTGMLRHHQLLVVKI